MTVTLTAVVLIEGSKVPLTLQSHYIIGNKIVG